MPYSKDHKAKTRAHIVETARKMFNQHGFEGVSIDAIMDRAGLTRGGFYNHFKNKEALYSEAVTSFLMGRGAKWRADAGIDMTGLDPQMARQMIESYLSKDHLTDVDDQCPMIALPSDVARAKDSVGQSYQVLVEAIVSLFETGLAKQSPAPREAALSIAALCIGGMVLARTVPDAQLSEDIRSAAKHTALTLTQTSSAASNK